MKDKDSQRTEDEVLNETFATFDEEITSQTDTETQTQESDAQPEKKKSASSSNAILLIAGGVAAVGIIGYMFVLKPMLSSPVAEPATVQTQVAPVPPAPVSPPVEAPAPPPAPVVAAPVVSPESKVAQNFLTGAENRTPQAPVVVAPVTPEPLVQQANPGNNLQTIPSIPEIPRVVDVQNLNATSSAVVEELGKRFDTQNQQFRIALDDVGNRVSNLESFRNDQLNINKTVDERLVKLENGKVVARAPVVRNTNVDQTASAQRAPVRSTPRVKSVESNQNILVDKSEDRVSRKVTVSESREPEVKYNVHSVYGSRVWLKNSDGSLSTFTTGDKLPNGELIKKIDDEKFSIITDRRTIKN